MITETTTFANTLGEMLAPFLVVIRATGFFEAHVFIPLMCFLSVVLFIGLKNRAMTNGVLEVGMRKKGFYVFLFGYYSLCFLLTNASAVAFKTLIVEEMDYDQMYWFVPYVGPLHFYIVSVVLAHLHLVKSNRSSLFNRVLIVYAQIGYLGGYAVGVHRLLTEPFELTDVTTGMSGIFFFIWFGVLNFDLVLHYFSQAQTNKAQISKSGMVNVS